MDKEKLNIFEDYLKAGISTLLIPSSYMDILDNCVVLNSNIDISELDGHYEYIDYCPPKWYKELLDKSSNGICLLVINNINEIPLEEQTKFIEILKYNKISTFDLPKNCLVLVTCSDLKDIKINKEVASLLVQI